MAKKSVWKTLAGLAVAGAAVGSAIAYAKRCKEVNDLSEEDFDDLFEEEDAEVSCEKQVERTYTTLPTEDAAAEESEEDTAEEEVTEE